jgi:hypothetical protein
MCEVFWVIWVSLTLAVPTDTCPNNLSSWPVWQYSSAEWYDRNENTLADAQLAFDYCVEHGGQVMSEEGKGRPWCIGVGFKRPCFREPIVVLKYENFYSPGVPVGDCKDVVVELVPEDRAEWTVPFFDGGTLSFKGPRL